MSRYRVGNPYGTGMWKRIIDAKSNSNNPIAILGIEPPKEILEMAERALFCYREAEKLNDEANYLGRKLRTWHEDLESVKDAIHSAIDTRFMEIEANLILADGGMDLKEALAQIESWNPVDEISS